MVLGSVWQWALVVIIVAVAALLDRRFGMATVLAKMLEFDVLQIAASGEVFGPNTSHARTDIGHRSVRWYVFRSPKTPPVHHGRSIAQKQTGQRRNCLHRDEFCSVPATATLFGPSEADLRGSRPIILSTGRTAYGLQWCRPIRLKSHV